MTQSNRLPTAVVAGVGPGLGAALARRFAKGFAVALIARHSDYLATLADEIISMGASALAIPADLANSSQITEAFATINQHWGAPEVLIYNAASFPMGGVAEITSEEFERAWRVGVMGAFLCVKQVAEAMLTRGRGTILFTGATAGVKAGARSAAFGPAKFALRGLAQSMARDLGPRGVHVAYITIDGGIDTPQLRQRVPQRETEDLLQPAAIAETYWHLAHQDPSAWTMELEVRPFKEKF